VRTVLPDLAREVYSAVLRVAIFGHIRKIVKNCYTFRPLCPSAWTPLDEFS